jgi:hypothetical protein
VSRRYGRAVTPVSAPPRVAAHLRATPDGPVRLLHRGPDAVYAEVAGRCVGVVGSRATAVPCALRTMLDRLPDVVRVRMAGGVLHLDDEPLLVGRMVDVSVPRLAPSMVEELAQQASRHLRGPDADPGSPGVETGAERPPRPTGPPPGRPPVIDVAALIGRGDGLTPYGDDVLCGWLAVTRAAGVPTPEVDAAVLERAGTTTLLSATLLDCAMHGEVVPQFAAWLAGRGPVEAVERIGHSSGRGLVEGARLALAGLERVAA